MDKILAVQLRQLFETLPGDPGTVNWAALEQAMTGQNLVDLRNARQYVERGERGAAKHHVRLLVGRLLGPTTRQR